MPVFELRILGTPDLRRADGSGAEPAHLQPKRLALLACLALGSAAGPCRRDSVLARLWPERNQADGRNALNQALHQLRQALGRDAIVSRGADELQLSPEVIWCDAVAFNEALDAECLVAALDLYKGSLLDGLHVGDAAAFEHWADMQRDRFRHRAASAATALANRDEAEGNRAGSAAWLRRRLELEPDDENALRRLMNTLDRLGDRAGALRAYETFTRRLEQELEMQPSPETLALSARLRAESVIIPDDRTRPSIAVMPFSNMSLDREQDFFCDGITEEIINALAQVRGLRVVARTSVFAFRDEPADIRVLAERLGVQWVVEGSVRQANDRLRITAQLINGADGCHLWSGRYDRPRSDVFAIQDEIAHSVAESLQKELLHAPAPAAHSAGYSEAPPTKDMEAHALYLKGLFHRRKRTPEDLVNACEYFQKAVERDPSYAQAHAALAFTYALTGWFLFDVYPPRYAYPRARASAETALGLNDGLPEAHLAIANTLKAFEWNAPAADAAYRRALELDPHNSDALGNYASLLVLTGRFDEAVAITERAVEIDPLWIVPRAAVGIWLLLGRRFDEAIATLRQVRTLEPRHFIVSLFLGDANRFTGRLDDALAAYRYVLDLIGRRPIILGRLAELFALQDRSNDTAELLAELNALMNRRHVLPSIIAGVNVASGDHDRAFDWLQRAVRERDTTLALIDAWPGYDPIRSDPRFKALRKSMALAP